MEMFKDKTESMILKFNCRAMEKLKGCEFHEALAELKKAEKLLDSQNCSAVDCIITMNNLASYYKKTGNFRKALFYLTQSLEKESEINDAMNLAATYLNISSIYSQLNNQELSINNCQLCLAALKQCPESCPKAIKTRILANNTLGLQYKSLNYQYESAKAFKSAWELSKSSLGLNHPLTLQIRKNFKASCNRSESVSAARISRNSTKNALRDSYKKTPSCLPGCREKLPLIIENRKQSVINSKGQETNWHVWEMSQKHSRHKFRKPVQGVDPEKILNLQNIIEEIEGKICKNIQKTEEIKGILKTHRNSEKVEQWKKGDCSKTVKIREIRIKGEIKGLRNIEVSVEKENKPVAVKAKVQFCTDNKKSRAEDVVKNAVLMWVAKEKTLKREKAAVIIQKNMKCLSTFKLFKKIVNAAKFIQAFYRGYLVRKSLRAFADC